MTVQHVGGVKPAKFQKALGQPHGPADRPAEAITSGQPDQHVPTTIFRGE
jgi:hypothetical protein